MFGVTGFVYDCGVWLRLFSCSCLNETASSFSAKSALKENKMLDKEQTPADILCFNPKSPTSSTGSFSFLVFKCKVTKMAGLNLFFKYIFCGFYAFMIV